MRLSSVPVVALCLSMFSTVLCAADVTGSSDLQILPRLAGLPFDVVQLEGGHHLHLNDEQGASAVAHCINRLFAAS